MRSALAGFALANLVSFIRSGFFLEAHLRYECKYCSKDLPSAEKKHEHKRGCASRKEPDVIKLT